MKKPWPLQQRARAEPRLPPSSDCNKASNTPPCQGNRKEHKESCDFHPNPATTSPPGPKHGISRDTDTMGYWWDAQTSTHIHSSDVPLPIPAEMASWEASERPPPLPPSARNGAPTCTQPLSVEEQRGALPPPARKASEKVLEAWVHTPAQQEGGALPCPWGVSRSPQGNLGFHTNRGGTKQRHPSSASSVSEETRRNGKFQ